jgi:Xaa-Pro aminopeptidase
MREPRRPVIDFGFSDAERVRRWELVREQMAERDLACLVVYGDQAQYVHANQNLRWLTNANTEGFLVFPAQGDPVLVAFESPVLERPWVSDWRGGWPDFGKAVVTVLREHGLEREAIGFSGLSGLFGELGGFPHRSFAVVAEGLANARIEDATGAIEALRQTKSPEEIMCLEYGCAVAEKVVDAVANVAGPGVRDADVRAAVIGTLIRNGCEPGALLVYNQGKELIHAGDSGIWNEAGYATELEDGDVILLELDCAVYGYKAQFNLSFTVGEVDADWRALFAAASRAYQEGVRILRPGLRAMELQEVILGAIESDGFSWGNPPFHGLGLGLEEPIGSYPRANFFLDARDVEIRPNWVLELEPHPVTKDGRRGVSTGGPVLVTADGCRSLAPWYVPGPRSVEG